METINCSICRGVFIKDSMQEHHIYPLAYGGPKNGPLLMLCGHCHDNLHRQSLSLEAGTKKIFFPANQMDDALKYAAIIMRAKKKFLESGSIAEEGRNLISIRLNPILRQELTLVAKDHNLSIQNLVSKILETVIRRHLGKID